MSREPPFIRMLRESVEAELEPSVASAALFAALARWAPHLPTSFAEVVDVVHGPLRAELVRRVGAARAAELTRILDKRLLLAEVPTGQVGAAPRGAFDEAPTRTVPALTGPVPMAVAAASPMLATLIVSVLGPDRVQVADTPAVLILDASDPPADWSVAVWARTGAAPTILLYGAELEAGQAAARWLASAKLAFLGFESEHGIEPLLDLVRSRGRPEP